MAAKKIMLIRHAEKPDKKVTGVLTEGGTDEHSLSVQGWQRAGALALWLDPSHDYIKHAHLAPPDHLYAARYHEGHHSKRCYQTLLPLSEKLGIDINIKFKNEEYAEMVEHARARDGIVLISWHHESIPKVTAEILGDHTGIPVHWPDERFDVVWVFDSDAKGNYKFTQVPARLLAGDKKHAIS